MKKTSIIFIIIAVLLSDIMCFAVAYSYRGLMCGIEHQGFSAPASIAFLYAVPFIIGIIICITLAVRFNKKDGH